MNSVRTTADLAGFASDYLGAFHPVCGGKVSSITMQKLRNLVSRKLVCPSP
jgi:hypothetical protein